MKRVLCCLTMLAGAWVQAPVAQTMYQCKTPGGVMFSDKPCGEDAKKLTLRGSSGATSAGPAPVAELPPVPFEKFRYLPNDPEKVLEIVGPPTASFTHRGTEHWLYPNVERINDEGILTHPELLVDPEDGVFQQNYLPADMMKRAVRAAAAIGDWQRSGPVQTKPFYATTSGIANGDRKTAVVVRLGQPDAKKVFNGNEWWEYEQVRMSPENPQLLTLFLEFDGDVLISSAGN